MTMFLCSTKLALVFLCIGNSLCYDHIQIIAELLAAALGKTDYTSAVLKN